MEKQNTTKQHDSTQNSKRKTDIGIVFLTVVVTLAFGVPLSIWGAFQIAKESESLVTILVILGIPLLLICVLIIAYRHQILQFIFKSYHKKIEDISGHFAKSLGHSASFEYGKANQEFEKGVRAIAAWYSWTRTRNWMFQTGLLFFGGFATLLGSSLILKQNELIEKQTEMFATQDSISRYEKIKDLVFNDDIRGGQREDALKIYTSIQPSGNNFAQLSLRDLQLSNMSLRGANFRKSILQNTSFSGAILITPFFQKLSLVMMIVNLIASN